MKAWGECGWSPPPPPSHRIAPSCTYADGYQPPPRKLTPRIRQTPKKMKISDHPLIGKACPLKINIF